MKRFLLPFIFCACALPAGAQLVVTPSNAPSVIQALDGPGVTLSNIVIDCAANAIGSFNGANSQLGMSGGVLLTTGSALNAVGPSFFFNSSANNNRTGGDAVLADELGALPGLMFDCCTVDFQVIATSSPVTFNFVFGSEEYEEYVNAGFNDGFALLAKGPGLPPGWNNLAKIPNTTEAVAIDNVNQFDNTAFYRSNNLNQFSTIGYDGFTKVIQVSLDVTVGVPYYFKFAIADVIDAQFDSGVFIDLLKTIPLPVNLTHLTAKASSEGIKLGWNPACGGNTVVEYQILRSDNGGASFQTVGWPSLPNATNFECKNELTFLDQTAETHKRYLYRVAERYGDGQVGYSQTVEAENLKSDSPTLFPNPTDGTLTLTHAYDAPLRLALYDSYGRRVGEMHDVQNRRQTLDALVQDLAPGVYSLTLQTHSESKFFKFIKK